MSDAHVALTLQAATVAASALRALSTLRPVLGPPNGEVKGFEACLEALRALYRGPKPRKPPAPRPPKPRALPKLSRAQQRAEKVLEEELSEWDPEPLYEASRCQALLMEVIRRATHDYVLYRQHRKLELKSLAEQAYVWLFEEEPGHPAWRDREKALFKVSGEKGQVMVEVGSRRLTSFLSICEACSLDPEAVRARAREMTVESIMKTGRHIERRKSKSTGDLSSIEFHSLVDVDIDALDAEIQSGSQEYGYADYSLA